MKRFSWLHWLLALSLCGNLALGAVLAGRARAGVSVSAPVSGPSGSEASDAEGAPGDEALADAAADDTASKISHTWVLQRLDWWQEDLLEPTVIEVPAGKTEPEAIISHFLTEYDIGYELIEMELLDFQNGNTCRLVFGERTDGWNKVHPSTVYAALDGIWQTLSKRKQLDTHSYNFAMQLSLADGGPLTFPIDSSARKELANAPETWFIPADRPFTGSGADCLWRQEQVEPRWRWTPPDDTRLFALLSPLRGDAAAEEINSFIATISANTGGQWQELSDFSSPAQADPAFIRSAAFRSAVDYPVFRWEGAKCYATPEELEYLYPVYNALGGQYLVPGFYVEHAARQLFGDDLPFEHGNGWFMDRYSELGACYVAFQGGGGAGGAETLLLEYRYDGDRVTAVVACSFGWEFGSPDLFVHLRDGSIKYFEVDESFIPLDLAALRSCLVNEAARVQITLTKKPGGGFYLTGCKQLDSPPPQF